MYSVSLYTISEIGNSGNISRVYWPNRNGFNPQTQTIYLKTTTASVLDPALTFTQYVSGATQVNTGTIGTSSAANSLSFSTTSFPYDGSQNLLVIVKSVRSSGSNNDPQVQYNTSNSRHIQWVASGSDPSGNTGTLTNNRPNFGFDMTSAKALACADGNCYCIPTYTNVGDKLNSFTTTGGSNNINDADNTTGTYKNKYSTQYVEVAAGSTFDFSSPITGQNTNFYIWIDWNKNNIFEASEVVFSQYKSGNGLSFSGTINVPSGQANGNYRMRVRTAYTGGVSGTVYPCNNYDYGQARDYKVVVVNPTCSGKPTGGTLSISPAVGTPGSNANGTVSGDTPYEPGISYWWESSSDGITWNTIAGQTSANLSVAQAGTQDLYYRRITKCSVSGDTARSTIAMYSTFTNDWPTFSAWFKAEGLPAGKVTSWTGSGTPGITVTATPSVNQPTLIDGSVNYKQFNYRDRVKFDASNNTYLSNTSPASNLLGNDGGTIFGAFNNITSDATDFFYSPTVLYQLKVGFRYQSSSTSANTGYTREFTGTAPPTTELDNSSSRIITGWGINLTAGRVRGGQFNGVDLTNFIDNNSTYTPKISAGKFVFGKRIDNNNVDNLEKSDNSMAEFIMMNTPATASQRDKIESYLALQYGSTRGNNSGTATTYNYISTKGATIYDKSANSGFTNDIAGIGRDDVSTLNQKQSISVNVTDPVTVSLGSGAIPSKNSANSNTFSSNYSFFIWGNNGKIPQTVYGDASLQANLPPSLGPNAARIARIWKAQITNFSQAVAVGFETSLLRNYLPLTNLRLLVWNDPTNWTGATVISGATLNGSRIEFSVPASTITSAMPYFTLATIDYSATPLPVELISFNAVLNAQNMVDVTWATASELNSCYFAVERSKDAVNWETVGTIKGAGNSNALLNYSTQDKDPYAGLSYYRLKQVDLDSTFQYSKMVAVKLNKNILGIYPNPASDVMNIIFSSDKDQEIFIEVINSIGQLVQKEHFNVIRGSNSLNINVSKLAGGVYFINLKTDTPNNVEKARFTVVRQ